MTAPAVVTEVPQRDAGASSPRRVIGRGVMLAALIAAAWVALALRDPDVTYHVAPLIAAGSAPVATRERSRPHKSRVSLIAGAASTTLVLVIIAALALTDHLEGPTIWHTRPAAVEATMLAIVGGVGGLGGDAESAGPAGPTVQLKSCRTQRRTRSAARSVKLRWRAKLCFTWIVSSASRPHIGQTAT